jgi:putative transposase
MSSKPLSLTIVFVYGMWYTIYMKQTIALKLETTQEQFDALLETMEAFNAGCNRVAEVAFEKHSANKIALQPFVYPELRERFGLSSQMAVRCIGKACEAYKRDKSIKPKFDPHGAMVYDERLMNIKDAGHVSLLTLKGRVILSMRYGAYQAARLSMQKGQADLILRGSTFYLYICIDLPTPPPVETHGFLGVDLGIVEIASDSAGNQYSGEAVKRVRRNVREHRKQLQRRQTNSAKKRLRKIAAPLREFPLGVRDTNHSISKKLVSTALYLQKTLALEDLSGIRERCTVSRQMRWLLGGWAFDQLRQYVIYKAEAAGLCVVLVDPRNTSRICSRCGYCDKRNRKSQSKFQCLACGFETNADFNASRNIEARAEQSCGLMSSGGS